MAIKWKKTQFAGVRYREHQTRRHSGRLDRYFTIRYKIDGKLKEEGIGWASDGWNAQKVSFIRNELKQGHKTGDGPSTLSEKRILEKEKAEKDTLQKEKTKKEKITFNQLFQVSYFPNTKTNKSEKSYRREDALFRLWIDPVIGDIPLKEITIFHLEEIKNNMAKGGRAARTIRYALAVIRQAFNFAIYTKIFDGISPTFHVKFPQADNKRLRFLTPKEANKLLAEIKKRSQQLYEISLISFRTGARADEIFSLKWADIDFDKGTLILWDTKNSNTRIGYITKDVKELLLAKQRGENKEYIFVSRNGEKIKEVSKTFKRAVKAIGLNDEITDDRMKVVFHSLRHTYASWLVEKGEDIYVVKKLLGHSSLQMTERYSHVANNTLQNAVKKIEKIKLDKSSKK